MLGEALMVVPIVNPGYSYVEKTIFFPEIFFDFNFGHKIPKIGSTRYMIYDSPLLLFIRAGHIVPTHQSLGSQTAEAARLRPLTLVIAFNCDFIHNTLCTAHGRFAISQSTYWSFSANQFQVSAFDLSPFTFTETFPSHRST